MYVYLVYGILTIYSAISAVFPAVVNINAIPPTSVLKAIEISSNDQNYKCPSLRSSKLFANISDILANCPNFKIAQSLDKIVDTKDIDNGLCILYYNNFENLCYLTNNATVDSLTFENVVPSLFEKNIDIVCKTLVDNTHIVKNAQPGIDAITRRLQSGMCNRLCTDLDAKVKPICSLSAYITNITVSIESANKDKTVGKTIKTSSLKVEKNLKAKDVLPQKDVIIKEIDTKQLEAAENPDIVNGVNKGLSTTNLENDANTEKVPIENTVLPIPTTSVLNGLIKSDMQQGEDKLEPGNPGISNVERGSQIEVAPASEKLEHTSKINNVEPIIKVNVQQNAGSTSDGSILQPAENQDEKTNSKNKELAHNINKQLGPNTYSGSKSTTKYPRPVQKNDVDTNDKPNLEPVSNLGKEKEGDTLSNAKEDVAENDDIEIEEGMAPVGDVNQDYGIEVAPKSSEVRSKAEIVKSTEKLKPLQTDEERFSISANYQNQNVDDSDSYFFSYFMMFCIIFICGYVAYHNKQKILALVVEGRRGRRPSRSRRPNSANYHKLDSNLEEAVTSTCNKNAPQVIY